MRASEAEAEAEGAMPWLLTFITIRATVNIGRYRARYTPSFMDRAQIHVANTTSAPL